MIQGISDGFRIGYDYKLHRTRKTTRKMKSAESHASVVQEYIFKECREEWLLGPFDPSLKEFSQIHASRFGVIPKGTSGKWRLTLDLSSLAGFSINDGISLEYCSLSHTSVDKAAKLAGSLGPHCCLAKVDIQSAYRIIPVHPDDRLLQGIVWQGNLCVDAALPFGLRSAPRIFTAMADALEWRGKFEGITHIIHYLDDFLILAPPGGSRCKQELEGLLALFGRLQVPVAAEKVEGPSTRLTFLRIKMDTSRMCLRLPSEKLDNLKRMVADWLLKKSCLIRDLQSLVGKLQHASKVVQLGRAFLRRLFELLKGRPKGQQLVHLCAAFRSDLMWWHVFLESWNGVGLLQGQLGSIPDINLFTDASGSFSASAWFNSF